MEGSPGIIQNEYNIMKSPIRDQFLILIAGWHQIESIYIVTMTFSWSLAVAGSIPDEVIVFFNWPNPSSRTVALGLTQPLTEMSTRNLPGGKGRPVRKADNLTVICEPIVYKMWELWRLTTLWAFTACYRDSLVGKADNLTAICEPIVYKMWEPWRLTTLWAFTACYRDSLVGKADNLTAICEPIVY
jgi:hypothetical protein